MAVPGWLWSSGGAGANRGRKIGAIEEGIRVDVVEAGSEYYVGQAGAISERPVPDGGDAVGDNDFAQT